MAIGFSAEDALAAGYTASEAKDAHFQLTELKDAGYVEGLKAAGFTAVEANSRVSRYVHDVVAGAPEMRRTAILRNSDVEARSGFDIY